MDADLLIELDDDRMDEGNSDDLPLELIPPSFNDDHHQSNRVLEVNCDYIDYSKLESELRNPALSYRLLHMLTVCPNRRPEIANVINRVHKLSSIDVEFYRRFATDIDRRKIADPNKPWPTIDREWLTKTDEEVHEMLEREAAALKKAQDEGIKENIRISMVRVFDINFRAGKFYDAAKLYSRSLRDYCSNPRSVVPMLLNHIKGLMFLQDYLRVETYLNQAERAVAECQERETKYDRNVAIFPRDEKASKALLQQAVKDSAKINAVMAVTKMCTKNYSTAADKFVAVDHEVFEFSDLLSASDIAYYGCFCALASYNRNQLKKKVIDNGNFRKFLEPEGKLVDLIQAFRNNSFTTVFQLLEEMRPLLILNMFIAPHQKQLYKLIRRRAFVQYISTFGVISLPTMAIVFRTDISELIDELVELIDTRVIDAQIDPIEEKLYRLDKDPTPVNAQRLSKIQKDLEERARVIILRSAIYLNGVNPSKEWEAEMEATGSGFGAGVGRRRRVHPFDNEDDDEDVSDDIEMVNQTQQLSFGNRGNMLNRLINRFTSSSSSRQNPMNTPSVTGIGRAGSTSTTGTNAESNVSDTDMADP